MKKLSLGTILTDIRAVIALIGIIVGVTLFIVVPIYRIEQKQALLDQRIETIKTNDLKHIESEITEIKSDVAIMEDRHRNIDETLIRIETLLQSSKNP